MFKIFGLLLILGGATGIGVLYGEMMKNRVEQLKDIYKSVLFMENEISYLYTPLPEVFESLGDKANEPFKSIYGRISELLINREVDEVSIAFQKAMRENMDKLYLNNEDIKLIKDFMKNIGEGDVEREVSVIKYTKEVIRKKIEDVEKDNYIKIKLYRTMGFSIGAVIAIIFI